MADLIYLTHRIPYPPNKGDKLRSFHLLKHLAARHRVHLGTFVDDADDIQHVETLREMCADLCVVRLDPWLARLRSVSGFATGEALTLAYYRNASLQRWVEQTVRERHIDTAVVFSGAMAQYVSRRVPTRMLIDFVDVDSAKWMQYAEAKKWPLSWLYRREGRRLLDFERAAAGRAARAVFVTDAESELFRRLAPECENRIETIGNGVDAEYFSPTREFASPFPPATSPIVFTGTMDYWPNIDCVQWFATDILPRLRVLRPDAQFVIVGMRPVPVVRALAGEGISVTGAVSDVRPYLRHASVVVAPLRVARGIQNKVLEAMAMGRPVVASEACAEGLDVVPGRQLLTAKNANDFVSAVQLLLSSPERASAIGQEARARVLSRYSWEVQLSRFGSIVDESDRRLGNTSTAVL